MRIGQFPSCPLRLRGRESEQLHTTRRSQDEYVLGAFAVNHKAKLKN